MVKRTDSGAKLSEYKFLPPFSNCDLSKLINLCVSLFLHFRMGVDNVVGIGMAPGVRALG